MSDFKLLGLAKSKRELEDQRRREDEVAAAKAFEEYINVFQDNNKTPSKVWVKAGVYEAGKKHEDIKDKGKLYKPTSRFESSSPAPSNSNLDDLRPERLGKKKEKEKKKSNLEIFKDELKLIQEEREERHRLKTVLGLQEVIKLPPKPGDELRASISLELDDVKMSSVDDSDPNTTNIYLGNLSTKSQVSEQQLMELFGKFGPLASVKVMWPRTDEEKLRGRLSGFVAFMNRRDGERALKNLAGKDLFGPDVKLGWGKAVPLPPFPIYIPPKMLEMAMPPPLSGLPFNAQPDKRDRNRIPPPGTPYPTDPKGIEEFERVLQSSVVKVVTPTDRNLLAIIHRMVEFVAREGPMFEAMVMNREIGNPAYRFLFENQSPAHIYYRWKLFSILQGESVQRWRTEEFRMFKSGSFWKPPTINLFTQGMPDELIPEEDRVIRQGTLSNAQRDRLERMLRNMKPEKHKIAEAMIFCIEHSESIDEICMTIKESLSNPTTELTKKIGRLYVLSDILHNCSTKGMNAIGYRKCFKGHLPSIFQEIHYAHQTAVSSANGSHAESFKQRVMACFRSWEEIEIYPNEFLIRLQNIFLGLMTVNSREDEAKVLECEEEEEERDAKLMKRKSPPRALMPPKSALNLVRVMQSTEPGLASDLESELDGVPMRDETSEEEKGLNNEEKPKGGFIPSKWEAIDPEEVKAQAVTTTSKWDLFEDEGGSNSIGGVAPKSSDFPLPLVAGYEDGDEEDEEDIDGVPLAEEEGLKVGISPAPYENSEEWRLKLREIENSVLEYQDELESGRVKMSIGQSFHSLLSAFRQKLLKKAHKERRKALLRSESQTEEKIKKDRLEKEGNSERERDRSRTSSKHERADEKKSRRRSDSDNDVTPSRSERSSKKHGHGSRHQDSPKSSHHKSSRRSRSRSRSRSVKRKRKSRSRSRSPSSRSSRHRRHSKSKR